MVHSFLLLGSFTVSNTVELPGLPDSQEFINQSRDLAFSNLSIYFAAIIGVTLAYLILQSFWEN